ncbi:MAG: MFS transporter [Acidimicrobiales bacterium]
MGGHVSRRHVLSYARVIRTPGVLPALLSVYAGALPFGILNLALLLFVERRTGSIEVAGVVIASFGLGNAVGLIVQARFLDGGAPRRTIGAAGLLCTCMLVVSAFCAPPSVPPRFYFALVGVAGATVPAVTTFVRSSLPALVADLGERASAYALLAVLFQAAVATGPLLVSCTLLVAGPMAAILGAAGAVLVATAACLLAADGLQSRHRESSARAGGRPRSSAGLRTVVSVGACVGIATGLTAVAVPAAAIAHRHSVIAGLAFGALAIGDLCGGMIIGGRLGRAWSVTARLQCSLLAAAIASMMAAGASYRPVLLVPILFLGGVTGAPIGITLSTLLDQLVDSRHLAGAYAVLVSAGVAAAASGSALASSAMGVTGPAGPLLCGGAVLVVADVWSIARRRTFFSDSSLECR